MIDITSAVSLFSVMFDTAFWASMMIVLVFAIKIIFVVINRIKSFRFG